MVAANGMADGHESVMKHLAERHLVEPVQEICVREHARMEDVLGKLRRASVVRARRIVWAWCRSELGMSYPEIAELFGVDKGTVREGVLAVAADSARAA